MVRFPESRNVIEPGCARCPALVESRERIVWGTGPLDADIVVVGEAPGAGDPAADRWRGGNLTGMAYTTRHSGRRVRALIDETGHLARSYFTNAVKCFPAACDGSNREPAATELGNCRRHLVRELDRVNPAVVLPTGRHATASVFALAGRTVDRFLETVLEPIEFKPLEFVVVPLVHPSYQDVWIPRLGYDRSGYVRTLTRILDRTIE